MTGKTLRIGKCGAADVAQAAPAGHGASSRAGRRAGDADVWSARQTGDAREAFAE